MNLKAREISKYDIMCPYLLFYKMRCTFFEQTVQNVGILGLACDLCSPHRNTSVLFFSGRMSFTNNLSVCNNFVHNLLTRSTTRGVAKWTPDWKEFTNLAPT
jgi:hypothetical protein